MRARTSTDRRRLKGLAASVVIEPIQEISLDRKEADMPILSQIICDRCQAVKKETNHWYTLVVTDEGAFIRTMALTRPGIAEAGFTQPMQYLCGRLCAIEALDHWMAECSAPSTLTPR
jgi:hypothetical protein